jgi:mono/diheme cytochrome c family protein
LKKTLHNTADARRKNRPAAWTLEPKPYKDKLTAGLQLYHVYCGACHGPTGQGTPNLAPPLDGSEFVHGNPDKLALIALHGLHGPVTVKGRHYEFNGPMPGLAANPACSSADLAAILTFVRNAFSREPVTLTPEKIDSLRKVRPANGETFSVEEVK